MGEHRNVAGLTWTDEPFDVIVLSGSVPALDISFTDRLKPGGRLFAVIGSGPIKEATLITRMSTTSLASESLFDTDLPPLRNLTAGTRFQF